MEKIAGIWFRVQQSLFHVQECLPPLTEQQRRVIFVLEVVRIEEHIPPGCLQWLGRKRADRRTLARAFLVKAVLNLPTTKLLRERLQVDRSLRQICGWEQGRQVPSESTFSRAFAEFAALGLLDGVHEARVKEYLKEAQVWHVARDSTAIEAREKPAAKPKTEACPKYRRGRPRTGEVRPRKPQKRIARQRAQRAAEALAELPKACDVGTKKNAKGHQHHWVGYKFHVDVGDGELPLTAVTTSASVHDSQVAIPLMKLTAARVSSWYELMDSAYDAAPIRQQSQELGHVPIIEANGRRGKPTEMEPDRVRRYCHRSQAERFNSRLKDNCGGRFVRVRGHPKVHAHLMFGLLVIFAEALLKLLG
jgi:hypothetical protein